MKKSPLATHALAFSLSAAALALAPRDPTLGILDCFSPVCAAAAACFSECCLSIATTGLLLSVMTASIAAARFSAATAGAACGCSQLLVRTRSAGGEAGSPSAGAEAARLPPPLRNSLRSS